MERTPTNLGGSMPRARSKGLVQAIERSPFTVNLEVTFLI